MRAEASKNHWMKISSEDEHQTSTFHAIATEVNLNLLGTLSVSQKVQRQGPIALIPNLPKMSSYMIQKLSIWHIVTFIGQVFEINAQICKHLTRMTIRKALKSRNVRANFLALKKLDSQDLLARFRDRGNSTFFALMSVVDNGSLLGILGRFYTKKNHSREYFSIQIQRERIFETQLLFVIIITIFLRREFLGNVEF